MKNAHHVDTMNARRYLVLLILVLGSTPGDVFLSHGMKQVGQITISRWHDLLFAITNPSIILGILLLLVFFASYLSSLSWADLSYLMLRPPALLARFTLPEHIPVTRWAGILLITFGVGFVARGPSLSVVPAPAGYEVRRHASREIRYSSEERSWQ
jgi:uncharacterized membrane protein